MHVVLFTFSVAERESFEDIEKVWLPEVQNSVYMFMGIMVATRIEERETRSDCVSEQEGRAMAERLKMLGYYEVSAKKNEGVQELVEYACNVILQDIGKKKKKAKKGQHRCTLA